MLSFAVCASLTARCVLCDCVALVRPVAGRDYEFKWLAKWRKQNPNLLVINDRVQGGPLTQEDTSCSDVSLYSVGQDKIPNTMGGGYAEVHHSDEVFDFMVQETESLPFESAWDRLVFVVSEHRTLYDRLHAPEVTGGQHCYSRMRTAGQPISSQFCLVTAFWFHFLLLFVSFWSPPLTIMVSFSNRTQYAG